VEKARDKQYIYGLVVKREGMRPFTRTMCGRIILNWMLE
jgi:hypothetical protein